MAFNPSPKVAEARRLAKLWDQEQVIIITLNNGTLTCVSYGKNQKLCAEAKNLADVAWDAIGKEIVIRGK